MLGQHSLFQPESDDPLRLRVTVELITAAQARHVLEKWHYLKRRRAGRQIHYAVLIDGVVDGVITYAHPMTSGTIAEVPVDETIEFARLFLYRNVPHSASCAIAKTLRRVKADWLRAYPDSKAPRLVVAWSDRHYHKGTIYKAANFRWLRLTRGKGHSNTHGSIRGVREKHPDYKHRKDCWIYWLR